MKVQLPSGTVIIHSLWIFTLTSHCKRNWGFFFRMKKVNLLSVENQGGLYLYYWIISGPVVDRVVSDWLLCHHVGTLSAGGVR